MNLESIIEREISRQRFLAATGAAFAGLALGNPVLAASEQAKKGGTFTFADAAIAPNIAPFGSVSSPTSIVTTLVYDSLLTWDRHLKPVPALAESYSIPNKTTYVFKLRKGVKFHSGKELDSEDVVYSMGLQKNPPPPGAINSFYPAIAHVEAVDKYTVKFHMLHPDATVLNYLAWGRYSPIVPKGLYKKINVSTKADGTGPFQVASFVPNDHITLVAHRTSWRPIPYFNQFVIKQLADLNSRVSALRSGEVQGATIDADTAKILASDHGVQIQRGLTAAFREINITIKGDGKPWDDVRVRQAVNYAIDRQAIINKVYAGNGVYTSHIPAGYGTWALGQHILRSKYEKQDVSKAKALLKAAGFAHGFPVTLQSISSPADYTEVAQVIASQLHAVGINVTVQPMEIGIFATNNGKGNFEWQSTGRGMRDDPSGFMADFDPSGSIYAAWYKGGYKNNNLTKLIAKGLGTTDIKTRHHLYKMMQEIILTQWPEFPLVNPYAFQAVSSKVAGTYLSYDGFYTGLRGGWFK